MAFTRTGIYYYKPILLCTKNVFVLLLSGVPAWRLMYVYSIAVGFYPVFAVDPMLLPSRSPCKCHGEVCICSLWSHVNVLTFFPLTRRCSEGLDAFWFFFKHMWTFSNNISVKFEVKYRIRREDSIVLLNSKTRLIMGWKLFRTGNLSFSR